jgi:hypothetical protein
MAAHGSVATVQVRRPHCSVQVRRLQRRGLTPGDMPSTESGSCVSHGRSDGVGEKTTEGQVVETHVRTDKV